jgi:hypothetical protein
MHTTARLKDMTRQDVLVLADQAKDQGLGLTPLDPRGKVRLAYLVYCPPELEKAFAEVFPHLVAKVRRFNNTPSREVYLFEEAAVLAVLTDYGLEQAKLERHVCRFWHGGTYIRVIRARRTA